MSDDTVPSVGTGPTTASGVTLEDGVIRLRPLIMADAEAWLVGEDDEVRRWFQFPRASTRADVRGAIESWTRSWMQGGRTHNFGIVTLDDETLVGGVEARNEGEGSAYLSYQVFAPYRRRGLASRAVRLASAHAREAMPVTRLVIIIDQDNAASRGVAEAAGFRLEGLAAYWEHTERGTMLRYIHP